MKANRNFIQDERGQTGAVQLMVAGILQILGFVVILGFWPTLTASVNTAQDDANTSGTADTTLGLIPTIFAAALLISGIVFLVAGAKRLGGST